MYVVGTIEILSAVGLLLSFWKKKLIPIFSIILSVVMVGAICTHLIAGQGIVVAMMPFVLLILCIILLLGYRKL